MMLEAKEIKKDLEEEDIEKKLNNTFIEFFYSIQQCRRENGIERNELEIKIETMIIQHKTVDLSEVLSLLFD